MSPLNSIKGFEPARGLKNAHLQTLYSALFRKLSPPDGEIEPFELSDGDFLDCFWYQKPSKESLKPIVVLFHGLEGSYKSPYIAGIMHSLHANGYSSVLMHFRGCSGRDNRLARCYHSGDTQDARELLASLHQRFPKIPLFAIGYSLGGNMLLKLLGEERTPLIRAISVSAPLQLDICADKMNSGFSKIYQYHLMKHLKKSLLRKYNEHDMHGLIGVDSQGVKKMRSFWEFDNTYTGPIHGFSSAQNYYQESSAKQYLFAITTPTLIIHALDDPFMTPQILPNKNEISSRVRLEVSTHGGHVGFIGGSIFRPHYWLEERIIRYLKEEK